MSDVKSSIQKFFDDSPVGLWRTDINTGKFLMANQKCASTLGFTIEELLQLSVKDFYDRSDLLNMLAVKGFVPKYEVEITLPSGRRMWVSLTASIQADQGYIEGSLVDITEIKAAEADRIQKQKEELEKVQKLKQEIQQKVDSLPPCKDEKKP